MTWWAAAAYCESAGKRLPTEAEWEFVADAWTASQAASPASDAATPERRVIRGGSFGASPINLRVRHRDSHPAAGAGSHVGFRCAQSSN